MGTTADLRPGAFIKFNGELAQVLESTHRTPGNLRAFYQVKMRVVRTGRLMENRYRSGETIEFVRVEKKPFQYLYREGNMLVFMDQETYEQIHVPEEIVGEPLKFLKENQDVQISFEESNVLGVDLPANVNLRITHTEPGLKGDTATNVLKPATTETGATINVPIFVNEGDLVRIDTATGDYLDRVKE